MQKVDTISSLEGRKLLADVYHELRYEKQLSSIATLLLCWRICTHEIDVYKYVKKEVTLVHKLGFFSGTAIWMEEVVNRYYYSNINSFVYLGAAILLTIIGIRRFTESISDTIVIGGVAFEALMLIFLFVVMFFSPKDLDYESLTKDEQEEEETISDLIVEVGEIGRDFAAVSVQLENMAEQFKEIVNLQSDMIDSMNSVAESTAQAIAPNPEMIDMMRETNEALADFKNTVKELAHTTELLRKDQIEIAVRKEVERVLLNKLTS